ncbi:MAG: hypothetical protein IPM23_19915 [Candidatus Melainabacteria bacterium]|nr:hypothetical protein [Candidatus Melainabacteria bacterium]
MFRLRPWISLRFRIAAAFFLSLAVLSAMALAIEAKIIEPKMPPKPASNEVDFTTIARGSFSGIKTAERLAIRDEGTWLSVWHRHSSELQYCDPAPHVDFEKSMVVAVFQGEGSSRSGLIQVDCIKAFQDKIVVLLSDSGQTGGKGARNTTRSFHIVKTPRSLLPVVFR